MARITKLPECTSTLRGSTWQAAPGSSQLKLRTPRAISHLSGIGIPGNRLNQPGPHGWQQMGSNASCGFPRLPGGLPPPRPPAAPRGG
eukprot:6441395-Alexandrium_andersonii.AAC.1